MLGSFSKICQKILILVKFGQEQRTLHMKTISSVNPLNIYWSEVCFEQKLHRRMKHAFYVQHTFFSSLTLFQIIKRKHGNTPKLSRYFCIASFFVTLRGLRCATAHDWSPWHTVAQCHQCPQQLRSCSNYGQAECSRTPCWTSWRVHTRSKRAK